MQTDKDREEARRREAVDFARKIFKTFTGELQAHPIDITFERDARLRAEAKAEALREAAERVEKYMDGNHPPHYYSVGVHNALMGYSDIIADESTEKGE